MTLALSKFTLARILFTFRWITHLSLSRTNDRTADTSCAYALSHGETPCFPWLPDVLCSSTLDGLTKSMLPCPDLERLTCQWHNLPHADGVIINVVICSSIGYISLCADVRCVRMWPHISFRPFGVRSAAFRQPLCSLKSGRLHES